MSSPMKFEVKEIQGLLSRKNPERSYWTLKAKVDLASYKEVMNE